MRLLVCGESETPVLALAWKMSFPWRGQGLRAGVRGEESTLIRESHPMEPRITELPHVGMRGSCVWGGGNITGSRREMWLMN